MLEMEICVEFNVSLRSLRQAEKWKKESEKSKKTGNSFCSALCSTFQTNLAKVTAKGYAPPTGTALLLEALTLTHAQ